MIRPVKKEDAGAICTIYNYYIEKTTVSFEEVPVSISEMEQRITDHTKNYPWLVCEDTTGAVTGYCYASQWHTRAAYKHSVELSIYIDKSKHENGIGSALYRELVPLLRNQGVHVMVACIALPNDPSRLFHEKLGFKNAAHFHEVGKKFGSWVDIGYWEYLL